MPFHRSEDGSILIEFSLVLTPLVLIFACMVDYALWIQKGMLVQDAASAAAAYGAMPGKASETANMTSLANYIATGSTSGAAWFTVNAPTNFWTCTPGGSQVSATTTCPTGAPYHYVQVTTSASPSALMGFHWVPSSLTLHGAATYRVEVTP